LGCPQQSSCTIPEEIGKPARDGQGNYGKMHLRGALVAKYEYESELTAYFPVPVDVVQVKDKKNLSTETPLRYLCPLQQSLPGNNDLTHSLLPLWTPEIQPVEAIQGYWSHQELTEYLLGRNITNFTSKGKLYESESRFGNEVENSLQITKESKLYQTEFIRCQENIGLYIEIEGIQHLSVEPDPEMGLIAIGGENRVASYTKLVGINWGDFREGLRSHLKVLQETRFKLYFATPTIFKQGWL
jgi:CRISPR-associated protein Cmr3